MDFEFKDNYDISDLIKLVKVLRQPDGCPWDREQTHESIKKDLIEETYEVIEAINKNDPYSLKEELGDVLLQLVMHCEIESEVDSFNFNDVCDEIVKKLIVRHPHVFSDVVAENTSKVLDNWDAIKMKSKGMNTQTEYLLSVPKEFPALIRAQKVQKRAAKVGFDWDSIQGPKDKILEEFNELKIALENNDSDNIKEEFGDLLFSCVNLARFINCDAEEVLNISTEKFINRFNKVEQFAKETGKSLDECSLVELDELWEKAKLIVD